MQTLSRVSRRAFLRRLTATGLAAPFVARGWMAVSPNGKLRHASFGATGMAWADVNEIARHASVTVVAAADVDLTRTAEFKQKFPEARVYQDWRELLGTTPFPDRGSIFIGTNGVSWEVAGL